MNDEDSISKPKIQFNTLLEWESIKEQHIKYKKLHR